MNALVLGAGRMGIRHCLGLLSIPEIKSIDLVDINEASLENAKQQLAGKDGTDKVNYHLTDAYFKQGEKIDLAIIAATAGGRKETCEKIITLSPKYILVEKPLGQSLEQVQELASFFDSQKNVKAFVNLNTRLYPAYNKLKNDLKTLPQFKGRKTISINTGTIGIGANGIHYIDLVKYLLDADKLELVSGEVDETIIPSGRGPQFCDFGGWAVVDYKNTKNEILGRVHFILNSQSTVLGPWEITGTHGRILIDEFEATRFNKYRKSESELPVQRYAGDYLPIVTEEFSIPFLNDLTNLWVKELIKGNSVLPELKESLVVHELMFKWLELSKTHKKVYPIT